MNAYLPELFEKLCPEEKFSGWLFHGTQLSGAIEIAGADGFDPRATESSHHTSLPLVSTSQNDNVLTLFGDGSGFCFFVPPENPLRIRRLHPFFHAATTAHETTTEMLDDMIEDPAWEAEAIKAGFIDEAGYKTRGLSADDFMELVGDADGLAFPGFDSKHPRAEAEIGLTESGCAKIWQMLEFVNILKDEMEPAVGLAKLKAMHAEEKEVALAGRAPQTPEVEAAALRK